jgi:hypothetical protein
MRLGHSPNEPNAPSLPLLGILYALVICLLARNYALDLFSQISIHYNEGPLLDQAMRLTRGEPIYRSDLSSPPYTVTNYGPVYHLLQWPFLMLSGPTMVYGKVISLLSHLASAFFAGLIMRKLSRSHAVASVTGLIVLAAPMLGGNGPLYRVDLLAQAFSLAGMYVALIATDQRRYVFAALLFSAAIYTKQPYAFAGPGVVVLYHLWLTKWKQALFFACSLVALAAGIFAFGQWYTGGGFLLHLVLANMNEFSLDTFLGYLPRVLPISCVAFCGIAIVCLMRRPAREALVFACIYLLLSCGIAICSGKLGSNEGYFSEFHIALAFFMGLLVAPSKRVRPDVKNSDTSLLIAGQVLLYAAALWQSTYHGYLQTLYSSQMQLKHTIETSPGIVLADTHMGLVALSGKPLYYQPFEMNQLWRSGLWSQDKFLDDLRRKKFSLIVIHDLPETNRRWSDGMMHMIRTHYRVTETINQAQVWRPN